MENDHQSLTNQTLKWHGTDTETLYQRNLSVYLEDLKRGNWIDREITYKFNSQGFRSDEFDSSDKNAMFLGCSHTLGVGLPYESTWAYIISQQLNLKNYNLGIGGGANDTAFRLANFWIDRLQPDIVFFLSTEPTRFELHTNAYNVGGYNVQHISVWNYEWYYHTKEFMKNWYSSDINSDLNLLKNTLAIRQLCSERNIKFVELSVLEVNGVDKARDLTHYGEQTHKTIAETFLSKL